jgi:hypothetical protein
MFFRTDLAKLDVPGSQGQPGMAAKLKASADRISGQATWSPQAPRPYSTLLRLRGDFLIDLI